MVSLTAQIEDVRARMLGLEVSSFYWSHEAALVESMAKPRGLDWLVTAVTAAEAGYAVMYHNHCIAAAAIGLMDDEVQAHIRVLAREARKRYRLGRSLLD